MRQSLERAYADLRESEQRFRDYAETASDWFWATGPEHDFSYFSEQVDLGIDWGKLIGKRRWDVAADFASEPEHWREHMATLERREPFRDFVYKVRRVDGSLGFVSISGKPVFDAEGRFSGYRGVARETLRPFSAVEVVSETLESWPLERAAFDLVFAAQAFHWLPADLRFHKSADALRANGTLAVIGNISLFEATPVWLAIGLMVSALIVRLCMTRSLSGTLKALGLMTFLPGLLGIVCAMFGRDVLLRRFAETIPRFQEVRPAIELYLDRVVPQVVYLTVGFFVAGALLLMLGSWLAPEGRS